jgi:hypothetical protein
VAFAELIGVWIDGPPDEALPANTSQVLEIPAGSDVGVGLALVDQNTQSVDLDLTGSDRLVLTVRSVADGAVLLEKQATKLAELGRYFFSLANADTRELAGLRVYDVWVTRSGAQKQVVAPSHFRVGARIRQ